MLQHYTVLENVEATFLLYLIHILLKWNMKPLHCTCTMPGPVIFKIGTCVLVYTVWVLKNYIKIQRVIDFMFHTFARSLLICINWWILFGCQGSRVSCVRTAPLTCVVAAVNAGTAAVWSLIRLLSPSSAVCATWDTPVVGDHSYCHLHWQLGHCVWYDVILLILFSLNLFERHDFIAIYVMFEKCSRLILS